MKLFLENILPGWTHEFVSENLSPMKTDEEKMSFAIQLAELNVRNKTGGPFGAAIFETQSGKLVSIGVNLVLQTKCSHAHAEMIAIALAQEKLSTHDLGAPSFPEHELVTSCEPCAMCLGAIPWSGVKKVVCGARGQDALSIGFDEGAKPENWAGELEKRGINVYEDVLKDDALKVLQQYENMGGVIY